MNRNNMPLVLMLTAGAVTYAITYLRGYPLQEQLLILLLVLAVFYFLGNVMKWTLNHFENENEKARQAQEAQEKEESSEDVEEVLPPS